MRSDWSILLSNKEYFEYYRDDQKELFTNQNNIISFLKNVLGYDDPYEVFNNYEFDINTTKTIEQLDINSIKQMMSKDVSVYEALSNNDKYNIRFDDTVIRFAIKDLNNKNIIQKYKWYLKQVYFDPAFADPVSNNQSSNFNLFITGHSAIRPLE